MSTETKPKEPNSLRRSWRRFIFPYGRRRDFNPMKWRPVERVVVFTQGMAMGTVIISLVAELTQTWPDWMPISPGILALVSSSLTSLILMGLVWHTVTAGDLPLTNRRAHYIRQVVDAMEFEKQGAVMDWDSVGPDGGIPFVRVPSHWRK